MPCFQTHLSTAVCSLQLNWPSSTTDCQENMHHSNSTRQHFVITSPQAPFFTVLSIIPFIFYSRSDGGHLHLWHPFFSIFVWDFFLNLFHSLQPVCPFLNIYIKGIICQTPEAAKNKDSGLNQHTTGESWATPDQTTIAHAKTYNWLTAFQTPPACCNVVCNDTQKKNNKIFA